MSVYAMKDPRDGRLRYVGRTSRPVIRFKAHLARPHSLRMARWIGELRAAGLQPEFVLLEGATEREWIVRLRPDLNVLAGKDDDGGSAPDIIAVSVRLPREVYEAAVRLAGADDRTLNSYVVRALRAQVDRDLAAASPVTRKGDRR